MSEGENNKPPHDPAYHEQPEGQMQGWEMHQQQMNYQYARMSPSDAPPPHPSQYSGQMIHGGAGQHLPMMSHPGAGGAAGAGYLSYPHGHVVHPSYAYQQPPPQQQQQGHPSYYPHHPHQPPNPYYPQYQHHPSQFTRNSPHPMEAADYDKADPAQMNHQAYYGYGAYIPHAGAEGQPPSAYGMMHPGMHDQQHHHHPPHALHPHAPGMEMAKAPHPHSAPPAQRGVSFEHPNPSLAASSSADPDLHGPVVQPSASADRGLSLQSSVVKSNPSDDATITSTDGAPSPPGIPPPPASQSGSLSAASEKNRTPESHGGEAPLRESHHHSNQESNKAQTVMEAPGSSEKKQTLDTASVLLAFSSTKKPRPASETSMMDDNDSKCSFPTLPTEPSFSSMISEPPSDQFVVPTQYPKRLTTDDDEEKLNALHCYMRSDLLEIVVIQPTNNNASGEKAGTVEAKNMPTSTDPQMIGRVGLRCVFCAMSPDGGRAGPSMSIFYPRTVSEIYRLVTSWKRCHLSKCRHLPPNVRQALDGFKECRARGKTAYWIDSAHAIGLVDIPTKIGGVRFQTDSTGKIQSAVRPASQSLSLQSSESKPDEKEAAIQE